jgi:hypothetical protein
MVRWSGWATCSRPDGRAAMNPPRLIPLVLMLIVVLAIIYYMRP